MDIKEQISRISKEPGVYIFRDSRDKIIYIGKAINLRSRVRSYWNKSSWGDRPKLGILVPKITRIETIITKSEKEALILESNLVFKHQPRYNVLLKDNKSYPWLMITYDEDYPRLIPIRNIDKFKKAGRHKKNSRNKFYGPYTNVSAMYENLELVHELFPLRRKRVPPFKHRPCLNYDLGKCLGPCQKLISVDEYMDMIRQVEMLLNGDYQDLKSILQREMQYYSEELKYEKAAKVRDRLKALETFNERQHVISQDHNLDQDSFVLVVDKDLNNNKNGDVACLQVLKVRAGKLVNRDSLELEFSPDDNEKEIFEEAFVQYYAQVPDTELPKEILTSHSITTQRDRHVANAPRDDEDKTVIESETKQSQDNVIASETKQSPRHEDIYSEWLSERKGSKVNIVTPKRGEKYAQIELARKNGKVIIEKIKLEQLEDSSKNINEALTKLKTELALKNEPTRIECFDISHIQGTNVVASMVCFIDGMPAKDEYRRFKISKDQNNDFESMQEAVRRRYQKFASPELDRARDEAIAKDENENSLPQLIIIDGGKGQLSAACEVVQNLGLSDIAIVGLAKKDEEIFLPGESRPILLDRKSPELFLVQRIRNEAHRFAVTYHRRLRAKASTESVLDQIRGLGPEKKKSLLKHFGSLSKLKQASVDDIAGLQGFGETLARTIKEHLA